MNDTTLSLAAIALLVASSTTGALAASTIAVNHGSSMEPTLCNGAVLIVDRSATPELGDVVALDSNQELVYHRLVGRDGRDLIIRGDNNRHAGPDLINGSYPHRDDVVGVVSHVVYDGCGPL